MLSLSRSLSKLLRSFYSIWRGCHATTFWMTASKHLADLQPSYLLLFTTTYALLVMQYSLKFALVFSSLPICDARSLKSQEGADCVQCSTLDLRRLIPSSACLSCSSCSTSSLWCSCLCKCMLSAGVSVQSVVCTGKMRLDLCANKGAAIQHVCFMAAWVVKLDSVTWPLQVWV